MSSLSFLSNPSAALVADASVVINLNATSRAAEIIRAFPYPFFVTDNACAELAAGVERGHDDYRLLTDLIAAGVVQQARLGAIGLSVYESLINGSTLHTLDDGEAATIAFAHENGGTALIDERKARTLCCVSFPSLPVVSTVELLMHEVVAAALGAKGQSEALVSALTQARMRVPREHLNRLKAMIGAERAALCLSLPKAVRTETATAT